MSYQQYSTESSQQQEMNKYLSGPREINNYYPLSSLENIIPKSQTTTTTTFQPIYQKPSISIYDNSSVMQDSRNYQIGAAVVCEDKKSRLNYSSVFDSTVHRPEQQMIFASRLSQQQENVNPTELFKQEFQNQSKSKQQNSISKQQHVSIVEVPSISTLESSIHFQSSGLISHQLQQQHLQQQQSQYHYQTPSNVLTSSSSSSSKLNGKKDPLDRPLKNLLENAISKAISQSQRVLTPTSNDRSHLDTSLALYVSEQQQQNQKSRSSNTQDSYMMSLNTLPSTISECSGYRNRTQKSPLRSTTPSRLWRGRNDDSSSRRTSERITLVERQSSPNLCRSPANRHKTHVSERGGQSSQSPMNSNRNSSNSRSGSRSSSSYLGQHQKKGSPYGRSGSNVQIESRVKPNQFEESLKKLSISRQNSSNRIKQGSGVANMLTPKCSRMVDMKQGLSNSRSMTRIPQYQSQNGQNNHQMMTATPSVKQIIIVPASYEQQLSKMISNSDVQNFLKKHFLVGSSPESQQLICEAWDRIPLVYFQKLLFQEFPEVLEDYSIGESLIADLKQAMSNLIKRDAERGGEEDRCAFVDLNKLQEFTKTTGLLGLILKGLKNLSQEESEVPKVETTTTTTTASMSRNSIAQFQTKKSSISPTSRRTCMNSSSTSIMNDSTLMMKKKQQQKSNVFERMESSADLLVMNLQKNDVQNIKNIIQVINNFDSNLFILSIQLFNELVVLNSYYYLNRILLITKEFMESLYSEMENEIYSKFNSEMRRMTCKYSDTQGLLKLVSERVSDNFGILQKDAAQKNTIQELNKANQVLTSQLEVKSLELIHVSSQLESQRQLNSHLYSENQRLQERCEKFLQISMQNLQVVKESHVEDKFMYLAQVQSTFFEQQIAYIKQIQNSSQQRDTNILGNNVSAVSAASISGTNNHLRSHSTCQNRGLSEQKQQLEQTCTSDYYAESSDIDMLIKLLDHFMCCQQSAERDVSGSKKRNGSETTGLLISVDVAKERMKLMIEALPIMLQIDTISQSTNLNFLQHFLMLQQHLSQNNEATSKIQTYCEVDLLNMNSIQWNHRWMKLIEDQKNADQREFDRLNSKLGAQNCEDQGILSKQILTFNSAIEVQPIKKNILNHNQQETTLVQLNNKLKSNRGITRIIVGILNACLESLNLHEYKTQGINPAELEQFKLAIIINMNILLIAKDTGEITNSLKYLINLAKTCSLDERMISFVIENRIADTILTALLSIDSTDTNIIKESVMYLSSFKQVSSTYLLFMKQLSSEKNIAILLRIIDSLTDSQAILMILNLVKNMSFSVNFKENSQSLLNETFKRFTEKSSNVAFKHNDEKEIIDVIKIIKGNMYSGSSSLRLTSVSLRS